MNVHALIAFFDELDKIASAQQSPMSVPAPATAEDPVAKQLQAGGPGGLPAPKAPAIAPPKPPVAEQLKGIATKGGAVLKNIENVISAPQKPHRYLGTAYAKDFSGFKYS